MKPPDWTDAETRILIDDWLLGRTATEIAKKTGKTKNAVIGKAHRLYLPKRTKPETARKPTPKRPRPKRVRAKPKPILPRNPQNPPQLPTAPPTEIRLGRGSCVFPMWGHKDKVDQRFCGEPARQGSVYCPEHHAKCYTTWVPRHLREEKESA